MVLPFHKIARLQSTSYYRTKSRYYRTTIPMDTFLEVLRKEKIFENVENFQKKKIYKTVPFSLALQCAVQNFRLQQKQTVRKMFLESFLKFGNLSGKGL